MCVLTVAVVAGAFHDLTPIHEWLFGWLEGARVFGDKAFSR